MRAIPHMKELAAHFENQKVVVLGISTDKMNQKEKVEEVVEEHGIEYACGIDVGGIAGRYLVRGIPCVVLIDQNGVVQGRHVGFSERKPAAIRADIESMLGGKASGGRTEREGADPPESSSALNEKFFIKKWETRMNLEGRRWVRSSEKVLWRMPSRTSVVISGNEMILIDATRGERAGAVSLPEYALENKKALRHPKYVFLRSPAGGVAVAVTPVYNAAAKERRGKFLSEFQKTEVAAFNRNGNKIWTAEIPKRNNRVLGIGALPVAPDRDVLFLSTAEKMILINPAGQTVLEQKLAADDQIEISDIDQDGSPDFLVTGTRAACYKLRPEAVK